MIKSILKQTKDRNNVQNLDLNSKRVEVKLQCDCICTYMLVHTCTNACERFKNKSILVVFVIMVVEALLLSLLLLLIPN